MFLFVVLGLLVCSEAQVIPVFVQTGKDFLLDVKVTLGEGDIFTCLVNGMTTILTYFKYSGVKPIVSARYVFRIDIIAQKYSLLLKNVQLSDSGVYAALVYNGSFTVVADYNLTVQDPVSPVNLKVKSCSSDRSNLTVVCRTLDSNISSTFTCRNQTCSHDGGEGTTPGASLDVYLTDGTVICNHSNQVSSENDVKKIVDVCGLHSGSGFCMPRIMVVSVGLFIMVCAVISVHIFERLKKKEPLIHPTIAVLNVPAFRVKSPLEVLTTGH